MSRLVCSSHGTHRTALTCSLKSLKLEDFKQSEQNAKIKHAKRYSQAINISATSTGKHTLRELIPGTSVKPEFGFGEWI